MLLETCFVIAFFLFTIFMSLGIGIAGFKQLSADGASFIAAHVTSIGSSANGATVAAGVFHQVTPPQISTSIQPDPRLTTPPVDYQYASPYSGSGYGSSTLVSPAIAESVTKQSYTLFNGMAARIQAVSREPVPYVYSTTKITGGSANAGGKMAAGAQPAGAIGDIPHFYYETSHWYCDSQQQPSATETQPCTNGLTYGVANQNSQYNATNPFAVPLALAEELDVNNQSRSVPGLVPSQNSVNWEILWHQQFYAALSQYFAKNPWNCTGSCNNVFAQYNPHANYYMQTMAHWDGFPSGIEGGNIYGNYPTSEYDLGYGYAGKTAGQMSGSP